MLSLTNCTQSQQLNEVMHLPENYCKSLSNFPDSSLCNLYSNHKFRIDKYYLTRSLILTGRKFNIKSKKHQMNAEIEMSVKRNK